MSLLRNTLYNSYSETLAFFPFVIEVSSLTLFSVVLLMPDTDTEDEPGVDCPWGTNNGEIFECTSLRIDI